MALPPKHWIDSLDAIGGAPKVTHPHGGTAYPRVERVFTTPKGQETKQPATLADYAGSVLVQLEEISRDTNRVKLYVRYDTIPGPWVESTRLDEDGAIVTVKTRENLKGAIASVETVTGGVWTRSNKGEGGNAITAPEIVQTRAVPGEWVYELPVDAEGVLVEVKKRLQLASAIVQVSTATIKTEAVDYPGSALVAWESVTTLGEVFGGNAYSVEKADLTPSKFKAAIVETSTESTVAGIAAAPTLAAGEFSASEQQVTKSKKRVRRSSRTTPLSTTLVGERIIDGDVAAVTETLYRADQPTPTLTPSATLVQGEVETLGDGRTVKTEVTVALFNEAAASKSAQDFTPERFKKSVVEVETSFVSPGGDTSISAPAPGETIRKQRVNAQKTRETTRALEIEKAESIVHKKLGEFGPSTVTETLGDGQPSALPTVTHLTLSAEANTIAGDQHVKSVENLGSSIVLKSSEVDPKTKVVINVEKSIVAPSTAKEGIIDGWFYEHKNAPWSDKASIQLRSKIVSMPTTAKTFYRPISVSFPDVLKSAKLIGMVAWTENHVDLKIALQADIVEGYRGMRNARVVRTFHETEPAAPSNLWQPSPVQKTVTVGFYWVRGSGAGSYMNQITIPATLHGGIDLAISEFYSNGLGADFPYNDLVKVKPGNLAATSPAAVPAEVLYHVTIEEMRLGGFMMEKFYVRTGSAGGLSGTLLLGNFPDGTLLASS